MLRRTGIALASLVLPLAVVTAPPASATGTETIGGPALASTGIVLQPLAGATRLPTITAESWVLADLTTGEVLAAKNAHRQGLPASTLKTLTSLTLMPRLDKTEVRTTTYAEASAEGGRVGIVPDATYTVWDLWHGLLLPSGNDAAAALADAGGGMAATVAAMQAEAVRLQANDTVVKNASGLDADGQVSSAYDLALIARAAMALEDFRTVTATESYNFPGRPVAAGAKRSTYKIYTQNRLLLHNFRGAIGGKTGFTTKAGRTFWGAAERDGHTLVVTLLQVGEKTETAAKALLDWGFANRTKLTPVGTLVDPIPPGGATPSASVSDNPTATATDDSVAAAGVTGTGSTSFPWGLVALVVLMAGAALLWWRRRGRPHDGSTPAVPSGPEAVIPPVAAPSRVAPASTRTSSVVVVPQGVPRAPAEVAPEPVTAPQPIVTQDEADAALELAAEPAEPVVPVAEPAPAPAPTPRPGGIGHVRVITPPAREPRDG